MTESYKLKQKRSSLSLEPEKDINKSEEEEPRKVTKRYKRKQKAAIIFIRTRKEIGKLEEELEKVTKSYKLK